IDHQGKSAGTNTETDPGSVFVIDGARSAPGALILDGGTLPDTSVVTGGNAADKGGGICVNEYGELTLHDVTIKGNNANKRGGGVFLTSDGTGHGKMTVGGKVTIEGNKQGGTFSDVALIGENADDLYIGGEDGPGMDVFGIENDSDYPMTTDSRIFVSHLPRERVMRDDNREMMGCFKNEREGYVFRYKNIYNVNPEKSGNYIIMVPEPSILPQIQNVVFSTAEGEEIQPIGKPDINAANKTITIKLNTEDDLKFLYAEISTTQEVMIRAKDGDPGLLPAGRQDYGMYAGSFAAADYSGDAGRTFILYGFDKDDKHPNETEEWTVKVQANKRKVTFDTMGGGALTDNTLNPVTVNVNTSLREVTNNTGEVIAFPGRVFDDWFFDKNSQRRVSGSELVKDNLTLYAGWIIRNYPILYDAKTSSGPSDNPDNPDYFNVKSDNLTIDNPKDYSNHQFHNGRLFIGWEYNDLHNRTVLVGNTLSPTIPGGSFLNAAPYSQNYDSTYLDQQYNVILDFGGAAQNKNVMVEHDKSFNANDYIPQDQSLPTGAKWLTDINNHESDCNNQKFTTDTTLYAAYALTLNATEGNFSNDSIKGMQRFYAINDDYTSFLSESASILSRGNSDNKRYVFDGWYTADTGGTKVSSGVMPNHNVTLYAHWLEVPVNTNNTTNTWETIRFDTGGVDMPAGAHGIALKQGSTEITTSDFNFDAKPFRNGYIFDGWYAAEGYNADGSLINPSENQIWNGNSGPQSLSLPECSGDPKDLTLYAKWKLSETQTHTVSFRVDHHVMQPDGSFTVYQSKTQDFPIGFNPVMEVPTLTDDELKSAFGISGSTSVNDVVVKPHVQSVRVDDYKVLPQAVNYYYIRKSFPYFYQYNGTPTSFIDQSKSTKIGYYPYGATITIAYTNKNNLLHGSAFSHWTKEIDGVDQKVESHSDKFQTLMPAGLLSLKPVTTPYSGTLDIKLDGGNLTNTADANANPAVKDNKITFTGKTGSFTMPTPKKEGYEFVGWRFTKKINNTDKTFTANPLIINTYEEIDNRTTYTAVWEKTDKTYSVDFDLNGHGAPQPKSQTGLAPGSKLPRDCVIAIKNVKAAGYNDEDDEVDWYKDSACTDGQKFDVNNGTVTENMTLYAKWTPQNNNVTLNLNGGSIANGQKSPFKYTIEDHAITLINPTWPGKTFAGWTGTGLDKPTVNVTIPTGSTGNRTYKANWTTGLYTVNFDTQGKGKAPADQKVLGDDNHLVQRPVNPTEKGYSFEGWFTDKAGTVPYSFNYPLKASQLTNGTLTLYAKWKPIVYQLNLDANGGKFKDGSKEKTERRTINENISIIYTDNFTPTRENYLFMGWSTAKKTDEGEYFEDKTMPPLNLTLYADWYEIPFVEITFDTQGGTVLPTQFVRSGQKITKPNDPQKTGYVFEGWYTDPEHKARWNFNDPATDSITLYANWRLNQYKLTLDPNTGTFSDGSSAKKEKNTIQYGADLSQYLETVTPPSGKKFIGWFSGHSMADADHQYTAKDKMPAHNLTLVAQYCDYRCIYFDANGGKLSIQDPLVEVIDGQPITPPEVTRTGYKFDYWYLDDASQEFNFNNISWADGETVKVLKAKWEPNPLTITLDANSGKFSDQSSTKTHHAFYDDTAISFGNTDPKQSIYDLDNRPTKEGYFFVGWYTDPTKETDTYVDGSQPLTENITYYAHWTPAPGIVVMFETFGGSTVQPQNLEGGQTATRPTTNPTKPGRTFDNWYVDREYTTLFDFDKRITKNTVVFAKWNTINYHINADPDGGTISTTKKQGVEITSETVGNKTYTKYQYTYDTPTFSVDNPTRNGYTFTGWEWTITGNNNQQIKRKSTTYTVPEGSTVNQDIKATWKVNQYNIKYDLDGGKMNGSDTNPTTYNVESDLITLKEPKREGYTFAGWTGSNGDAPQTSVNITQGSTGDREYKANWTPIEYTITCDLASGSLPEGKTNPETYTIKSETIVLNNPTREGYTFVGWTSNEFTGTMQKVTIPKGSTGAKSYTATWTRITYNITYDLDGGKMNDGENNPATYNIETEDITLKEPTKKGYNFTGWTGSNGDA
ncbi:MAG: InlB B-repeat-containing protein, partial [Eubacteriaceae bacterium]|nr:InlB B-repeat-containing protein [Eubacteriaceae bacterium]